MANAVVSRELGDEYQQLVFWKYALDMLSGHHDIKSIRFEDDEVKSFDDVVVEYSKPQKYRDVSIIKEYYQIKYHVRDNDYITLDNLLDPAFINAAKHSLLDKVVSAYHDMGRADFLKSTFIIYTMWDIGQDDELYSLVDNNNRTIRLDLLFNGITDSSKMGKIRKKLREKLKITEDDLKIILRQVRIFSRQETMDDLKSLINVKLEHQGLQVIEGSRYINPYVQLIQNLHKAGHTIFDKTFLEKELYNEGLYMPVKEEFVVAIRSFTRYVESIENESNKLLKLEEYFDGRFLKEGYSWEDIFKQVSIFLKTSCIDTKRYYLQLEANTTIAFIAGRILDIKAGKDITPIQRTEHGVIKWSNSNYHGNYPQAITSDEIVDEQNFDVVLVIEFARKIYDDVKEYIEEEEMKIGRIIIVRLASISSQCVEDGVHAWELANQIKDIVDTRKLKEKKAVLHIFTACPNALVFLLGRYSLSFGQIVLYEYDFMKQRTCTYYSTISLPCKEEL